jgi:hypothetical protein
MNGKSTQWWTREVNIPRSLRELHGEQTRVSTLIAVYSAGLIVGGVVAWQLAGSGLPVWKIIVATLLFLDIGGGVVANLSRSTNRYYQDHAGLRLPFLALHVFHPALLALLFPAALPYFAFAGAFTLAGAFAVNAVKDSELQQNLAALFVAVGIACSFLFPVNSIVLYAFAPLFMVKLILGFAVRREQ